MISLNLVCSLFVTSLDLDFPSYRPVRLRATSKKPIADVSYRISSALYGPIIPFVICCRQALLSLIIVAGGNVCQGHLLSSLSDFRNNVNRFQNRIDPMLHCHYKHSATLCKMNRSSPCSATVTSDDNRTQNGQHPT